MSKHIILKSLLTIFLGVGTGYGITLLTNQGENLEQAQRTIASSPKALKLGQDQMSYDFFDLQLSNEVLADSFEQNSIIRATVTAKKDIPDTLQFKWHLGEGVTSADSLEGSIFSLKAGDTQIFELQVQQYSKLSSSHVSFYVLGNLAQQKVDRQAIISSKMEESLEYIIQQAELHKRNENQKGVQKLSTGLSNTQKKFNPDKVIR